MHGYITKWKLFILSLGLGLVCLYMFAYQAGDYTQVRYICSWSILIAMSKIMHIVMLCRLIVLL